MTAPDQRSKPGRQAGRDTARAPAKAPPRRRPKILVVDDEVDVLRSTQMLLDLLQCDVIVLPDWRRVSEVIASEHPDLVLHDVLMPGLDIDEAFRSLRSSPGAQPPLVLFSASDDLPDRAARLDVDGYLHKPFSEEQLRQVIESLLGPLGDRPVAAPEAKGLSAGEQRELDRFFHEYRDIFTALNNYAQAMLPGDNLPSSERQAVAEIRRLLTDLERRTEELRSRLLGTRLTGR